MLMTPGITTLRRYPHRSHDLIARHRRLRAKLGSDADDGRPGRSRRERPESLPHSNRPSDQPQSAGK